MIVIYREELEKINLPGRVIEKAVGKDVVVIGGSQIGVKIQRFVFFGKGKSSRFPFHQYVLFIDYHLFSIHDL